MTNAMQKLPAVFLLAVLGTAGHGRSATLSPSDPAIADAAQRQDSAALRELLKHHALINAPQADGTTALQWAAHWDDAETVKLLLAAGADAKAANRYGATPLSEAAGLGNASVIEMLLKAGADPNARATYDGETILMTSARSGNTDAVRILLDHGADPNTKESYKGQTALMWAAAERHPGVAKLLLQHGADWKVRSFDRETKLPKLSAASSVTPFARGGMTAFQFTAREGDVETAKVMLDAGVDINYPDIDGTSGLVVSIMNKRYTFAKFLLDRGADPNATDVKGRAALYAAVDMRNEDWTALPSRKLEDSYPSLDLMKAILARGAKVDATLTRNLPGRSGMDAGDTTLDEGTTPLMRAARSGDAATMRLLLDAGADPKLATKEGSTAVQFAAGVGYRDKQTKGTEAEALEALKVCVDLGMDINKPNSKGETALHGAASRGADSIVKYLVEHGAKLDAKTGRGFTPLDVAIGKDQFALPVPHDSTVALIRTLGGVEGGH
jgi:ankyrin repeat protein